MKTMKTLLAAAVLAGAPGLALAEGCNYGHQQAQSCAPGTTWDATSGGCVTDTTS